MKLYYEALQHDLSDILPLTFHIKSVQDPEYQRFIDCYCTIQNADGETRKGSGFI